MAAPMRALVFGGRGGIGNALVQHIRKVHPDAEVICTSRDHGWVGDFNAEHRGEAARVRAVAVDPTREGEMVRFHEGLATACEELDIAADAFQPQMVVNAVGILHNPTTGLKPEVSLKKITAATYTENFNANALSNFLVLKYLFAGGEGSGAPGPILSRKSSGVFAALSARVGSVSENKLGGWYTYRASKAALNQLVKTASIETARTHPKWCLLAYHPGTVASDLSDPFVRGEKRANIVTGSSLDEIDAVDELRFSPDAPVYWSAEVGAGKLYKVLDAHRDEAIGKAASGVLLDYAGRHIPW